MTTDGVGAGKGIVSAGGLVGAGVADVVSRMPGVTSGTALVGRGVDAVGGVARGVVLMASGCPQLVSANTSSKSLQKRTTSQILG
jgi:hypothetical protein